MDAVPESADAEGVEEYLTSLEGVTEVHDLHIWGLSTTETALTTHLVIPEVGDHDHLLLDACKTLHDRFGIEHATIQVEHTHAAASCVQAAPGTL
jgi:cobalt-zinc-cadmium efflux system protein